jgi:hypothetical protein
MVRTVNEAAYEDRLKWTPPRPDALIEGRRWTRSVGT